MKIPAVKQLVETYPVEVLRKAEDDLVEERALEIEVIGEDEGEKLTHIYAAIFILDKMQQDGLDFKTALREYTKKVRESIS
jgi:hypothetical protein